jgi:hypothetical protein
LIEGDCSGSRFLLGSVGMAPRTDYSEGHAAIALRTLTKKMLSFTIYRAKECI